MDAPVNACEVIFGKYYSCQIPQSFKYSEAQLKTFGTPSSGNPAIDRALADSPMDIYLTPVSMVEYFDEGCPIRFHKPTDIPEIHQMINSHLKDWAYILSHVFPLSHPPLDDFVRMDAFARQLAPLVGRYAERPLWVGGSAKYNTLRSNGLARRRSVSQRVEELKSCLSPVKGGQGESTPIKIIIDKLWGPEYEHTRDESLQRDIANWKQWRQSECGPMAGTYPQFWEDDQAPLRE